METLKLWARFNSLVVLGSAQAVIQASTRLFNNRKQPRSYDHKALQSYCSSRCLMAHEQCLWSALPQYYLKYNSAHFDVKKLLT